MFWCSSAEKREKPSQLLYGLRFIAIVCIAFEMFQFEEHRANTGAASVLSESECHRKRATGISD